MTTVIMTDRRSTTGGTTTATTKIRNRNVSYTTTTTNMIIDDDDNNNNNHDDDQHYCDCYEDDEYDRHKIENNNNNNWNDHNHHHDHHDFVSCCYNSKASSVSSTTPRKILTFTTTTTTSNNNKNNRNRNVDGGGIIGTVCSIDNDDDDDNTYYFDSATAFTEGVGGCVVSDNDEDNDEDDIHDDDDNSRRSTTSSTTTSSSNSTDFFSTHQLQYPFRNNDDDDDNNHDVVDCFYSTFSNAGIVSSSSNRTRRRTPIRRCHSNIINNNNNNNNNRVDNGGGGTVASTIYCSTGSNSSCCNSSISNNSSSSSTRNWVDVTNDDNNNNNNLNNAMFTTDYSTILHRIDENSVVHNSNNNNLQEQESQELQPGNIVRIIGGVHKGKYGTFIKHTEKRTTVQIHDTTSTTVQQQNPIVILSTPRHLMKSHVVKVIRNNETNNNHVQQQQQQQQQQGSSTNTQPPLHRQHQHQHHHHHADIPKQQQQQQRHHCNNYVSSRQRNIQEQQQQCQVRNQKQYNDKVNSFTPSQVSQPLHENQEQVPVPTLSSTIHRIESTRISLDNQKILFQDETLAMRIFPNRLAIRTAEISKKGGCALETFYYESGNKYELLSTKLLPKTNRCHWSSAREIRAMYVLTSSNNLPEINLQNELERLACFSHLTVEKVVARLELLQSTASMNNKSQVLISTDLTVNDFEEIDECGNEGCGFMPIHFAQRFYGNHQIGRRTFALQVRIIIPKLGIYKGMLMEKIGINRIQLPSSMKKVGPSIMLDENDDNSNRVYLLVNGKFPSDDNAIRFPKIFKHQRLAKSYKPKPLSLMIQRILQTWPIADDIVHEYVNNYLTDPQLLRHTCVVGLADPTGCIPPGTVFITGITTASMIKDTIFVSRFPCTEATTDAHLLPVLRERPTNMSEEQWSWLTSIHFGGIIFGNPILTSPTIADAVPLPCQIANGDLDGDLYFICWDETIMLNLMNQRAVGIQKTRLEHVATTSPTSTREGYKNRNWFDEAQDYMSNVRRVLIEQELIIKLYTLWKTKYTTRCNECAEENSREIIQTKNTNDDEEDEEDDYVHYGRAYKSALDIRKHGGFVYLPYDLWSELPESLHSMLTDRNETSF